MTIEQTPINIANSNISKNIWIFSVHIGIWKN